MSGDLGIIRRGVAAMEHDVSFWSLFMGQHILFDDLVGYCDGRQLLLFGARLGTREPASDGQINEVFDYAVDRLSVGYFECWRPGAPPCLARPDWATGSYREDAVPLAIPLSGFSVEGSTERAKQVRQADRRGFVFEENLSPNLESGDLRLIEDFLKGRQLTPFDMAYTFIAPYFTWAREGRTFRVRREGRTCALGTVSTFAPHVTTFVHTFVDRSARGASDLLYSGIIDFARARGSAHLDLGYSGTASLEEYKRSWGAVDRGECNQGTWARRARADLGVLPLADAHARGRSVLTPRADVFGLWNKLYSFEHNYLLDGNLFGDPRYEGSFLWYETSRDVAVVAFPFPLGSPQARDAALSFARRAAREVERGVRRSLRVFGDRDLVSQLLFEFPDLGEVYYTSPLKSGDFTMDDPNHLTKNRVAARAARRAAREGYAISRNGDDGLSMAHLACLRSFVAHRELADVDRMFFSALTLWASRPDVRLFDVVKAGRLVSFFLIHEWSSRLAFFLGSFAEAKLPFAGDAIMDFLHRRYVGTGGRVLLGPAVDPLNEAFKRKWARDVGNGPTMGAIFGGTDDDEVPRHLHVWWAAAALDMATVLKS